MNFSTRQYFRNWGLYVRGIRWLWTREAYSADGYWYWKGTRALIDAPHLIVYKPGYGPWRFLPIYLTTYLASVICGLGVVSLSRWWYDRSLGDLAYGDRPFSRFMTRLLDWAFPGSAHGRHTGPVLFGSKSAWD